jgi:hypothetical protein
LDFHENADVALYPCLPRTREEHEEILGRKKDLKSKILLTIQEDDGFSEGTGYSQTNEKILLPIS